MSRLYFAYAANMIVPEMARRCPEAALGGPARLAGHAFRITSRGYATVSPDPSREVWGVVWAIWPADEARLDRYEGVPEHLYFKLTVPVTPVAGDAAEALVYVARHTDIGTPQPGYLEQVIAAAALHGLPAAYLEELRGWLPGG